MGYLALRFSLPPLGPLPTVIRPFPAIPYRMRIGLPTQWDFSHFVLIWQLPMNNMADRNPSRKGMFKWGPLLGCCLLMLFRPASAQPNFRIDSLTAALPSMPEDSHKIDVLLELARLHRYDQKETSLRYLDRADALSQAISQPTGRLKSLLSRGNLHRHHLELDAAMACYTQALQLSDSIGDWRGKASACNNLAVILHDRGDAPAAKKHYREALALYERLNLPQKKAGTEISMASLLSDIGEYQAAQALLQSAAPTFLEAGDTLSSVKALVRIGNIFQHRAETDTALSYYFEALALSESADLLEGIVANYNNIATIYITGKLYDKAMHYLQQAKEKLTGTQLHNDMAIILFNIGKVNHRKEEWQAAEENYRASLGLRRKVEHMGGVVESLIGIGEMALEQEQMEEAEAHFREALSLGKSVQDPRKTANAHFGLGKVHLSRRQFSAAIGQFESGLRLSDRFGNPFELQTAHQSLYEAYKQSGNPKRALANYERYIHLRDSLYNMEHLLNLVEIEDKFQEEKSAREKLELALENEKARNLVREQKEYVQFLTFGIIGSIFFLLLLAILLYLWLRNRRLGMAARLRDLRHQALTAQMNPHFVFNAMNSIQRFILKNEQDAAYHYLEKFAALIRIIFENSKSSSIRLFDELRMLQLYVDLENLRFDEEFAFVQDISPEIDTSDLRIPPMLLQPLFENAIWHGLMPKKNGGILRLEVREEGDAVHFSVEDNGVGRLAARQNERLNHNSTGTASIQQRLRLLNGKLAREDDFQIHDLVSKDGKAKGTRVEFRLRYPN